MVVVELDESIAVEMTTGDAKPCAYSIRCDGEQVAQYETSADPRTAGGRVGLRNVVYRNVSGVEKDEIDERLSRAMSEHAEALEDEFGPK